MSHKSSNLFWVLIVIACSSITSVLSVNIAYPDSYEMYSYKQPRTINDLKNQHMRQAMIDVTETINEVQKILQKDPKLPRLTRGEIEDLFEMVTREEYKRSLAAGDYQRAKHMRSLMLVLPFNTNNYSEERLEELFTRMPVTKMVDNVPKVPKPQRIVIPATQESFMADMMGAPSLVMNQQMPTTFKPNFPINMKTMYTAPITTFHPKGNAQMITTLYPQPTGYASQNPGQMMLTNYYPRTAMQAISTFHPKAGAVPLAAGYSPNVNFNAIYPRTTAQTISNFHPKATLQGVATNAIPSGYISTYHPKMITHKSASEPIGISSSQIPYMTMPINHNRFTVPTTDETVRTVTPTIRPNVKSLLATIGLEPDSNALEINNQMSEMQQSPSTQAEVELESTVTTAVTPTPRITAATATTKKPELTPELKELLMSFGLLSNEEPKAQIAGPFQDELPSPSPSSLKDESLSVSEFKPLPKSITASEIEEKIDNSFEIKPDDFSSFKPLPIEDSAPTKDDKLESLLKSYGILEDDLASKISDSENVNDSDSQESESEVIEVTEKIQAMSRVPDVNVGFLSPDLTKVLGNIGINNVYKNQIQGTTSKSTRRLDKQPATTTAQLGTVPSSTMENDYQKLHLLLDTIKELDNLTANLTDEELEKLNLRNFNLSQDVLTESTGPDPTYGIENDADAVKNEVKREINSSEPTRIQLDITGTTSENPTASDDLSLDDDKSEDAIATTTTTASASVTTTATTTTTTETSERKGKQEDSDSEDSESENKTKTETVQEDATTESTKEEAKTGSMNDLSGSFGGNDGLDSSDPVSEEPLPPARKNGFYFFADWNSFLEVGLDDTDKVIVRFDPKIGSSAQFINPSFPNKSTR